MVQFGKSLEMFEMPLKINGTFYSVYSDCDESRRGSIKGRVILFIIIF